MSRATKTGTGTRLLAQRGAFVVLIMLTCCYVDVHENVQKRYSSGDCLDWVASPKAAVQTPLLIQLRAANAQVMRRQPERDDDVNRPVVSARGRRAQFGVGTLVHADRARSDPPNASARRHPTLHVPPDEVRSRSRSMGLPSPFVRTNVIEKKSSLVQPDAKPGLTETLDLIRDKKFDKALVLATRMTKASPDDPTGYNLQGTAYLGLKDPVNARKSFDAALRAHPDDAIALSNLAQIDIQQKDTANARKRFEAILAKDGNNVPAMLGMAQLEFLKGDGAAALSWFERAKVARPEAVDPRLNIAAYHMRRMSFAQAIAELTAAASAIPDNPDILALLGQAQLADGRNEAAVATFRKLVTAQPEAPLAYYRLATAQVGIKDSKGAAESLRKALQLQPNFVDATLMLAGIELQAKHYPEALGLAKGLQSTQPGSAAGLVLEGDILMAQERYADAASAYEKALAVSKTSQTVVKLHAAQARSGNSKVADATLQRWLKEHPDDLFALQYSAADDVSKGQNRAAIEKYLLILKKDPKNQTALNNLAGLYQQEGDPRALETAEAAYKLNPKSPVVADTLGWILVAQGKTERGVQLLEAALAQTPNDPQIRYHLAAARAKNGDKINARKDLEALLASGAAFPEREAAQSLLKQL